MDQEKAEQTSGEPASPNVAPVVCHSSEPQNEPVVAAAEETGPAPVLLDPADLESSMEGTAKVGMAEPIAAAATKADAVKSEVASEPSEPNKTEAPELGGKLIVLAPRDRDGAHDGAEARGNGRRRVFGRRRTAAVAAVLVLATLAGGLGGALATAALMRGGAGALSGNRALEASVMRIDAEMLALKVGLENNAKLGMARFGSTGDRLDRIEKAQAEPAAKLARLSEAVEKLHAATAPLPQPAPIVAPATTTAAKDATGSVPPQPAPKTEVGRLPTVEGWVLRDVTYGGALIEGRRGVYEVYAGDPVPGLGRVDAIRRQDGRWVVVTSRGLIVSRYRR